MTTPSPAQQQQPQQQVQASQGAPQQQYAILGLPATHQSGEFEVVAVGPDNWVEYSNGSRKYYHNRVTKSTQWQRPRELALRDWAEFTTPSGRKYFYNRVTKQSQWTPPDLADAAAPAPGSGAKPGGAAGADDELVEPATPSSSVGPSVASTRPGRAGSASDASDGCGAAGGDLLGIDEDDSTPRCTEEESVAEIDLRPRSPVESLDSTPSTPRNADRQELDPVELKEHEEYYAILSVTETSSLAEIKAAYYQLARRLHPDRSHIGERLVSVRQFQNVQQAYSVLIDPTKRRVYDAFVAYCRALEVDVASCVQEFRTFLDLCDCMGVAVQPGSRAVPVTLVLQSDPNRSVKEWRQYHTPDDRRYFVNFVTRTTQWEKPSVLNEYDVCSRLMGLRDFIAKQGSALQPAVPAQPAPAAAAQPAQRKAPPPRATPAKPGTSPLSARDFATVTRPVFAAQQQQQQQFAATVMRPGMASTGSYGNAFANAYRFA